MANNNHAAEPAMKSDLDELRRDAEAFALEQHDTEGRALPLDWIVHPGLVQQLRAELAPESFSPAGLNHALTQRLYVRTTSGRVLRFHLAEVSPSDPGYIVLGDGHLRATPRLPITIAAGYQMASYDSSHDRLRTVGAPGGSSSLRQTSSEVLPQDGDPIALYVYQDNDGANWNRDYATLHAASADTFAFGLTGLGALLDELERQKKAGKAVKVLVFAAHGTQAVVRIGPESDPFCGPSYVGLYKNQISPSAFGRALAPYLAKGAKVVLATCKTAGDGGKPQSDGSKMIQGMADTGPALVGGSDGLVFISGGQASTPGSWWSATPGEVTPKITKAAPAGNIDPPAP